MTEQTAENPAILQKWLLKTRSKDDREKINMQVEANEQVMEEKNEEASRKEKQARVHSVFSMVRSQIRTQGGLDGQHMGIMDVVNQITKELEKNKKEQDVPTPTVEIISPEENKADHEIEEETNEKQMIDSGDNTKEKGEGLCVALLEEILLNLESLRKEFRDELVQLRHETQSYTDQALCRLETRLTNSLRVQALARTTTLPRNHVPEPMEIRKQRPPSMPPLGTSRRRVLNRTMTTITPKTCLPLSLGPRSNSEPLGAWATETGANNSTPTREEVVSHPPTGPLPPAIPPAQKGKKVLRSRTRISK